jgi:hypothetical protein
MHSQSLDSVPSGWMDRHSWRGNWGTQFSRAGGKRRPVGYTPTLQELSAPTLVTACIGDWAPTFGATPTLLPPEARNSQQVGQV